MSGFFGIASKKDCAMQLFFGVDYHSHLGTRRGGLAIYGGLILGSISLCISLKIKKTNIRNRIKRGYS